MRPVAPATTGINAGAMFGFVGVELAGNANLVGLCELVADVATVAEAVGLTGITMTKLDGGGKGGVLLSIAERLDIPFRYIGVGEGIDDMGVFDADQFAAALTDTGG